MIIVASGFDRNVSVILKAIISYNTSTNLDVIYGIYFYKNKFSLSFFNLQSFPHENTDRFLKVVGNSLSYLKYNLFQMYTFVREKYIWWMFHTLMNAFYFSIIYIILAWN